MGLIPRFYDVSAGSVRIDGTDVRAVRIESLRRQIGIVLQDAKLLAGSVRTTSATGSRTPPDADIEAAARAAAAHEFIAGLPGGYGALVGERGIRLSGGQRQRIAIARALLTDPRILILDDSTSSVDFATESTIRERAGGAAPQPPVIRDRPAHQQRPRGGPDRRARPGPRRRDRRSRLAAGGEPPVRRYLRVAARRRSGAGAAPMTIGGGFTGAAGPMQIGAELQKAGDRRGTLRRFNRYLGGYRAPIAGIALLVVVEVALTSYAPRMLQVAVDGMAAFLNGESSLLAAAPRGRRGDGGGAGVVRGRLGCQRRRALRMVGIGRGYWRTSAATCSPRCTRCRWATSTRSRPATWCRAWPTTPA